MFVVSGLYLVVLGVVLLDCQCVCVVVYYDCVCVGGCVLVF